MKYLFNNIKWQNGYIRQLRYKLIKKPGKERDSGYTLIELLIVMMVMIAVGVIVVNILVTALRGNCKAETQNNVRQNGNYTIAQITKMIQYAKVLNGISNDGSSYVTDCTVPVSGNYLQITSFDGGITTFQCSTAVNCTDDPTISSNSASLLNTASVCLKSCNFTCSQSSALSPVTIGINFTLSQKNENSFAECRAEIPFETSVTMRNSGQ